MARLLIACCILTLAGVAHADDDLSSAGGNRPRQPQATESGPRDGESTADSEGDGEAKIVDPELSRSLKINSRPHTRMTVDPLAKDPKF